MNDNLTMDNLDLDSIDLGALGEDDIDNLDLNDFGVIDEDIHQPHIKMQTKAFKDFLKVAKQVASSSGRDIISRSVCFIAEEGEVRALSTDFDVYLEHKLELLNVSDVLAEPVVVPIDILIKLSKATPSNTIIYKEGDTFYMKLVGGDIPLETYEVTVDKFVFGDKLKKDTSVSSKDVYNIIKDFSPIVTAAVSPTERRIICDSKQAIASYMWSIISSKQTYSNMDLKIKDINVLKSLLVDVDEPLDIFDVEDAKVARKVIRGSKFSYAFLISDLSVSETLKDNMAEVLSEGGVYVDFVQLYKMVELSADLPYSIGKVGLNYSEEGELIFALKTKKGEDSIFKLAGSVDGNIAPLKKELTLQSKLLKILLRSFASQSSIRAAVSEKGLGISCDSYEAVVYSENN